MTRGLILLPLLLLASCNNQNDSIQSLLRQGHEHVNAGRMTKGLDTFSNVLKREPTNGVALCSRGSAYGELGRYEEALADLSSAIPNPVALLNRAYVCAKMKRYDEAIADSRELLAIDSKSADAYAIIASCYSALSDFELAADNYQKVSELEPENEMALINFGGMLVNLEQYEEAEKVFTKAILLAPKDYTGWALRFNSRRLAGDLAGAEADRQMARKLNPDWRSEDGKR